MTRFFASNESPETTSIENVFACSVTISKTSRALIFLTRVERGCESLEVTGEIFQIFCDALELLTTPGISENIM